MTCGTVQIHICLQCIKNKKMVRKANRKTAAIVAMFYKSLTLGPLLASGPSGGISFHATTPG